MSFGETNAASRIVYGLVGLSALYLATQIRTIVGASQPTRATSAAS